MVERNGHGDLARMMKFCRKGSGILGVDYFAGADAGKLAECLNSSYRRIIVDYGEITGAGLHDCARCDRKVIVGALSEWQAEAFLECVRAGADRDGSWSYAVAFGSEETRLSVEREFRTRVPRIPSSVDAFAVTRGGMRFFDQFLNIV